MGGGGGGNDSYEQKQAQIEAKKQAARDALNVVFGAGPATRTVAGPVTPEALANDGSIEMGQDFKGRNTGAYATSEQSTGSKENADARDKLYQTVRDNAYTAGKRSLDEKRSDAQRNLKFELFAKGLNGGSTDVDQNALLGRTYDHGIMDLGAKADAAKANMRNSDEQTRLGLLQSIDSGMDQGSALSSAINQMQVNSDKAAADAQGTTLGDLFANSALIYNRSQAAQGQQAGQNWWTQYRNNGIKPTPGATGLITTTG